MPTSRILSQGKNSQGKNQRNRVGKSANDDLPTHLTPHAAETVLNTNDQALVDRWLAELSSKRYSAATIKSYRQALQPFLAYCYEQHTELCHITRQQLSDFLIQRLDVDKISKSSSQYELTVLRQLYKWLIAQQLMTLNPTTTIRLKRAPRPLPTLLDIDVLSQLLDQAAPEDSHEARLWIRDKAMLELLYGSGLRVGELVGLNMSDIDKSQRLLRVLGKGGKTRIVPIGEKAWQALINYLPHRSLWVEEQDPAVFVSERYGTRISTRTVQLRIKLQAKRAGIAQDLYPHLLRHCFASHILSDSGDLRGVQELLGHSDISTTQIYTHLDFGHLSQVYDKAHPRSRR